MALDPNFKAFREGTERAVSPRETIERARPWFADFGITRVANVTGLDRVGIPVTAVFRPNSRSVCVAQGKGLAPEAAEASGIMEAVEGYHAENAVLPLMLSSQRELERDHAVIATRGLPRLSTSNFDPAARLLWTTGVDVATGAQLLLPYECVHTDFRVPAPSGSGAFLASSNGLASGNCLPEAISHGICELVERDATCLFLAAEGRRDGRSRVDPGTVSDAACAQVLACFDRAALEVAIWETTSDVGIPSFMATVVDRDSFCVRPMPPMSGYGCHPRRHIALLRALTEAAQGRLTVISGARDDLSARCFDDGTALSLAATLRRELAATSPARNFDAIPDFDHPTFEEDVQFELSALARAGLAQVVVVNLSKPKYGIPVVRVVIPGLEAMADVDGYVLGPRARSARQRTFLCE